MALASILSPTKPVRTKFRDETGNVDLLLVDVTINETATYEADITENPVESGIDVIDHIRPKPVSLQIEGFVSEAPLTLNEDLGGTVTNYVQSNAGGFATQAGAVLGNNLGSGYASTVAAAAGGQITAELMKSKTTNPADAARKKLEEMITNKIIFTLVTKRASYQNMAIVSLTFPRDQSTGQGLRFTAKFKQINIVQAKTTKITLIQRSASDGAANKTDRGEKPTTPVEGQGNSLLSRLTNIGVKK